MLNHVNAVQECDTETKQMDKTATYTVLCMGKTGNSAHIVKADNNRKATRHLHD